MTLSEQVLSTLPFKRNGCLEKKRGPLKNLMTPASRLCWEARHMTSYNRHRLAWTFRRFLASFFSVENPMASKMAFPQPGCLSCGLRSFLASTKKINQKCFNPADFHEEEMVWCVTLNIYYSNGKWRAHLVFDLPKFKVLGIKRSSLKLKLLLILLRE